MRPVIPDSSLTEIIRRIVGAIDPDRIVLFGSRARGTARPDSDYDLLVIKETTRRTLELEQDAYEALIGVRGPADILVETPGEVQRLSRAAGTVFPDALREGKIVYERSPR